MWWVILLVWDWASERGFDLVVELLGSLSGLGLVEWKALDLEQGRAWQTGLGSESKS